MDLQKVPLNHFLLLFLTLFNHPSIHASSAVFFIPPSIYPFINPNIHPFIPSFILHEQS